MRFGTHRLNYFWGVARGSMLHATNALIMVCMVEPMLWLLVMFSYSRYSPQARSRPFLFYLAVQLAVSALSVPFLFVVVTSSGPRSAEMMALYTPLFWLGEILSGVFAVATLRDILKRLLSVVPALQRVALIAFQWVLVIGIFMILSRMVGESGQASLTGELATLANGLNLTQLVLLLPLLPFTLSVQRTLRSHIQDMMMGLAVLAASSSVLYVGYHANGELSSAGAVISGHIILIATLIFWCRCFVAQGRREVPVTISMDSKLVRWSEQLRTLEGKSTEHLQ
ncbi:MAG: hypothetical protein ACP5M4_06920 [Acidobacteriaceae bacterium]